MSSEDGSCVRLPKGSKSHFSNGCPKGYTWRKAYRKRVRTTHKTLKGIERGMKSYVGASRISRECSDIEIARAMNQCMVRFIDPVEAQIKKEMHYDVSDATSEKNLALIARASKMGAECVIHTLSNCGKDKDQIRVMVDNYISQRLAVPSLVSDMQKQIVDNRTSKLNEFEEFVKSRRTGLGDTGNLFVSID